MRVTVFHGGPEAAASDVRQIYSGFQARAEGTRTGALGGCRAPVSRRGEPAAGMEGGLVVSRHNALRPGPVRRVRHSSKAIYRARTEIGCRVGILGAV